MSARQDYLSALERLAPDEVAGYLTGNGWREVDRRQRSAVWELVDEHEEERFEALVPRDGTVRDYLVRMADLLRLLSTIEERPEELILQDLTARLIDSQYFHTSPRTPSGTIPVPDGILALEGIRELMIAGAYSLTNEPRLVLPASKPREVQDFPRQVLIGPSAPGSYIIAAQVPVAAEDGTLFSTSPPFGRRVLLRLYDMIGSAREAVGEAIERPGLQPFVDRVGEGVSQSLCRGLAGLGGHDYDRPFEVRFSWASSRPPGVPTPPIRFDASLTTLLAQAADDLGAEQTAERANVTGAIFRTEGGNPNDPRWIVVRGTAEVGTRLRRSYVWVLLDPPAFSQALQAYDRGAQVRLEGVLVRTGQRTELQDLRSFTIVE